MKSDFWVQCNTRQVEGIVNEAISRFMHSDFLLLSLRDNKTGEDRKLHEVCIAHKLANHLQSVLQELSLIPEGTAIDIEYNRHGVDVKRFGDGTAFRPDILLHERTTDEQNYLVIEVKKDTNLGSGNRNVTDDISKIQELCAQNGPYKYRFGFVLLVTSDTIQIEYSHPEPQGAE